MFHITGNTFPHRDQLKLMGCKWNPSNRSWDTASEDVYRRGMELANGLGRTNHSRTIAPKGDGRMRQPVRREAPEDIRIEYPSAGATYSRNVYGVYKYGTYGRGSVLAGQQSRQFLATYETLEEATEAYPGAQLCGCGYQEPYLNHLSEDSDY